MTRLPALALLLAPLAVAPALAQDLPEPEPPDSVEAAETAPVIDSSTTQIRSGQDDEDVTVTGHGSDTVWAAGQTVEIDATAADAFAAGERVTLRGEVLDNFLGAGQRVSIKGPVGGDAFLFGEKLEVTADVGGDLYAAGESLLVPEGVTIGGNLYFGGAELELEGTVVGSVKGGGSDVRIDGDVAGDVQVHTAELHIGPQASIGGDLSYESPAQGQLSEGASVAGSVDWTEKQADDGSSHHHDDSSWGAQVAFRILLFLGSLLTGGLALLLFPGFVTRPAALLEEEAPVSLGVGFAALFGVPVLALALALFIVPLPVSFLAMAVYVPATFLARTVAAYAVGALALSRAGRTAGALGTLVAGLALLHLVYLVPVLGGLTWLGATVVGLGALFIAARRAAMPSAAAPAV